VFECSIQVRMSAAGRVPRCHLGHDGRADLHRLAAQRDRPRVGQGQAAQPPHGLTNAAAGNDESTHVADLAGTSRARVCPPVHPWRLWPPKSSGLRTYATSPMGDSDGDR